MYFHLCWMMTSFPTRSSVPSNSHFSVSLSHLLTVLIQFLFVNMWVFLWIKPTVALNSIFIVITTLHVSGSLLRQSSGVLRRTSALVHFMQLWWPFAIRSRNILLLVANGHQICIKCTNADVRLRTPDDGQKGCPKHVE